MSDIRVFPDITFAESDVETLANGIIQGYEELIDRKLYPADPARVLLQYVAQILSQERALINNCAKQNLPRYAKGKYLDSLCEIFQGVERLQPTSAQCKVEFMLSEPRNVIQIIPRGTRVTMNGTLTFSLNEDLTISPGETSAVGEVICDVPGTVGNGLLPGQISVCVDIYPYYKSVRNITTSEGGADVETDKALRERIRQSPESYSTAGPIGAYVYHAKSASALISDVKATSPSAGEVDVRILCNGGKLPDKEMLDIVLAALNDDRIRPLTDHVTVHPPVIKSFDVDITFYVSRDSGLNLTVAEEMVKSAVEEYIRWQTEKMGRDINPSTLIQKIMQTGVKRVEVTSPTFEVLSDIETAQVNEISITNGGYEYE